jgi:hypothetical protein
MLTTLAEKPPAPAGYRGSDLVLWIKTRLTADVVVRLGFTDAVEKGFALRAER